MIIVTKNPINPSVMYERIHKSDAGSDLLHYAIVKSQAGDRVSLGIHFEKIGNMEEELAEIDQDIRKRRAVDDILLVRRIGILDLGEIISLVAVSSPSSNDASDACHYGLARSKKMNTLNKVERFLDKKRRSDS